MTIQIKAIEQYFHVVLFIMLNEVVLNLNSLELTLVCISFQSADEALVCINSKKAIEQYFPVLLFVMLYKVVLTFHSQLRMKPSWSASVSIFSNKT